MALEQEKLERSAKLLFVDIFQGRPMQRHIVGDTAEATVTAHSSLGFCSLAMILSLYAIEMPIGLLNSMDNSMANS